jgi:NAD(P)-dependent dehydrogenase (short-subunit alcohol dehydrogenase family)
MSAQRRVLITGAASGIGAALARRIAGSDVAMLIHTRRNREGIDKVADEARAAGAKVAVELVDLEAAGTGRALVARAVEAMGGLDVVVANAGYALRKSAIEAGDDAFEAAHGAISRGFYEMATSAVPHLRQSSAGRIIAVSAFGPHVWRTQVPSFAVTSAAKASMETMAKSLALDLAPDGITVNVVAPGFIEKDAGAHFAVPPETAAAINQQIPMGRKGSQQEVAAVIDFIASPEASYVTGQVIHVNGGLV